MRADADFEELAFKGEGLGGCSPDGHPERRAMSSAAGRNSRALARERRRPPKQT